MNAGAPCVCAAEAIVGREDAVSFWTIPDRKGGRQIEQVQQGKRQRWSIYGPFNTAARADNQCSNMDQPAKLIPVSKLQLALVKRCASDKGDIGQ